MKRTTIFLDEATERDLEALAKRQRCSKAALVRTALEQYVTRQKKREKLDLGFVAIGRSGRSDIAERHEDLLWRDEADVEPKSGRARRSS